jgi:hypothetical protein
VTDFKPTTFDVAVAPHLQAGDGGVLVCEECVREHGSELVQFHDAMNEELRRL